MNTQDYVYAALIAGGPGRAWLVTFPDVPEAVAIGASLDQAKCNAAVALGGALKVYRADGRSLPRPKATGGNLVAIQISARDAEALTRLTPEEEALIAEELGNELHFFGDDLAVELGIPSREEREWTDEESDRIWAEIEERMRPWLTARALDPDGGPTDWG